MIACDENSTAQVVRARVDGFHTGSYHEQFADALSTAANPASLAFCRSFTAGVFAESKFLLNTVRHFIAAIGVPVGKDGAGFQLDHLTATGYSRSAIAVGYAKRLGQVIIGARFHYDHINIPGYGTSGSMSVETGSNWSITDNIKLAMCIYLPAGGGKTAYQYRSGIGFKLSGQLLIVMEAGREEDRPVNIHAGLYYRPTPQWMLQIGITTANAQPYMSSGFQLGDLRVLVMACYSFPLGASPGLAVMYIPKKPIIQ